MNRDLAYTDDADPANDDWLAACAIASDKDLAALTTSDFSFENCNWWTGSSSDVWEQGDLDLSPFAGESKVYVAFYFEGNNTRSGGVFVDEVSISGQSSSATVPEEPGFDDAGIETVNGSFDQPLVTPGARGWSKESSGGEVGDVAVANGEANITGSQVLYQNISVPTDTVDLHIEFTYALASTETTSDKDRFCVDLVSASDHSTVLVELVCRDVVDIPTFASDGKFFDSFASNLDQDQVEKVRGQDVALVFHLTQNGANPTIASFDNVVLYTTGPGSRAPGGTARDVGTQRDANEPNDSSDTATALPCNSTMAGVFGDVGGSSNKDFDWFKLDRVPAGKLVIDIDAATLNPASSADSLATLYKLDTNNQLVQVGESDDDSNSLDSLLSYDNTTADTTYYVLLYNYAEEGPSAFYTLKAQCAETAAATAAAQHHAGRERPSQPGRTQGLDGDSDAECRRPSVCGERQPE